MTPDERAAFIAQLQATSAILGHRMREDVADVYAKVLDDIPVTQLLLALDRLARTADAATHFPVPRELANLARGAWHRPARNLTDREADAVHQRVWRTMAECERTHPTGGSARPVFERAWRTAVAAEGLKLTPALDRAREATWTQWLTHGSELTRERIVEILADVAPKGSPTFLRAARDLVDSIERGESPESVAREGTASPLGSVAAAVLHRVATTDAPPTAPAEPVVAPVPEPHAVPEDIGSSDVVVPDASVDPTGTAPAEPAALHSATPDTPAAPAESAPPVEPPPFPEF